MSDYDKAEQWEPWLAALGRLMVTRNITKFPDQVDEAFDDLALTRARLAKAEAEIQHWKANHANEVAKKRHLHEMYDAQHGRLTEAEALLEDAQTFSPWRLLDGVRKCQFCYARYGVTGHAADCLYARISTFLEASE